ncbi:hypothetical protein K458DRAFT_103060 [Lentithecium fluviatile CBS 122367]|uniref:Uncharacterized protein n=1 Tax=Lentithecium fluviatile CBS 122367 TaxID=1168545 RepID=A0A6G1JJL7_9PLEO|nr:hypothetical protein K458DRAFT_103060 [Lentithecium fluviatile CBS 122367]
MHIWRLRWLWWRYRFLRTLHQSHPTQHQLLAKAMQIECAVRFSSGCSGLVCFSRKRWNCFFSTRFLCLLVGSGGGCGNAVAMGCMFGGVSCHPILCVLLHIPHIIVFPSCIFLYVTGLWSFGVLLCMVCGHRGVVG